MMEQLVRYAGYEPEDRPAIPTEERQRRREVMHSNRRRHALRLFRQGADTLQIAAHMNISEHVALR